MHSPNSLTTSVFPGIFHQWARKSKWELFNIVVVIGIYLQKVRTSTYGTATSLISSYADIAYYAELYYSNQFNEIFMEEYIWELT